jgi:hypothetical protein
MGPKLTAHVPAREGAARDREGQQPKLEIRVQLEAPDLSKPNPSLMNQQLGHNLFSRARNRHDPEPHLF